MRSSDLTETVIVKQCDSCGGGLPAADNFCRWCGIHQQTMTASVPNRADQSESGMKVSRSDREENQTLSSQLVNTLTHSISAKTTPLRHNRLGSNLIAAIITLPILLLIILLSPLDAFTAAKAAASQVNYR